MSENRYKIDAVYPHEARYKQQGGLKVGIAKGVRVEDIANEIIVICMSECSQLKNKEKAMEVLNSYDRLRKPDCSKYECCPANNATSSFCDTECKSCRYLNATLQTQLSAKDAEIEQLKGALVKIYSYSVQRLDKQEDRVVIKQDLLSVMTEKEYNDIKQALGEA